jgi:hypothetical protein
VRVYGRSSTYKLGANQRDDAVDVSRLVLQGRNTVRASPRRSKGALPIPGRDSLVCPLCALARLWCCALAFAAPRAHAPPAPAHTRACLPRLPRARRPATADRLQLQ